MHIELNGYIDAVWAERDKRLPVVLTKNEVQQVIAQMSGLHQMQAKLLYGTGMRLMECLRLRVKDIDFERNQIMVRDTKGNEDRATMLPPSMVPLLRQQLVKVKQLHEEDLAIGNGMVELPFALARKYPNADHRRRGLFEFSLHSLRLGEMTACINPGRVEAFYGCIS